MFCSPETDIQPEGAEDVSPVEGKSWSCSPTVILEIQSVMHDGPRQRRCKGECSTAFCLFEVSFNVLLKLKDCSTWPIASQVTRGSRVCFPVSYGSKNVLNGLRLHLLSIITIAVSILF